METSLILALDYETEWSEPVNPHIIRPIELGAVLYDYVLRKPVEIFNGIIHEKDHKEMPPELVQLTGITQKIKETHGVSPEDAMRSLNKMMEQADYVAAHNGNEFDKVVYEAESERLVMKHVDRPWIDTKVDVPYPDYIKTRKLTYLAAEHKIPLTHTHRALFDVLLMIQVMEQYDFKEIIAMSKQPTVTCVASVSYQDKDLAKKRGYYWDGESKEWKKAMKKPQADLEKEEAPFPVQVLMPL